MEIIDLEGCEAVSGGGLLLDIASAVQTAISFGVAAGTAANAVYSTNTQTYGYETSVELLAAGGLGA